MGENFNFVQNYLSHIPKGTHTGQTFETAHRTVPSYMVNGARWKPNYAFYKVYCDGDFVAQTYAKTKAQAINNVRHNSVGDVTDWDDYEWKAVKVES